MVEAPGTAPGSERFITITVYHHSHALRRDRANIGSRAAEGKRNFEAVYSGMPPFGLGAASRLVPVSADRATARQRLKM